MLSARTRSSWLLAELIAYGFQDIGDRGCRCEARRGPLASILAGHRHGARLWPTRGDRLSRPEKCEGPKLVLRPDVDDL